jgi:hypothetical protein
VQLFRPWHSSQTQTLQPWSEETQKVFTLISSPAVYRNSWFYINFVPETDLLNAERFRDQVKLWLGGKMPKKKRKIKKGFRDITSLADQQHSKLREKYLEGTGRWFFETEQVQSWLNKDCTTLVCPGIPGSGKTMLASEVVNQLLQIRSEADNTCDQSAQARIGVAFVYFNAMYEGDSLALILMKQLLSQLMENCPWSESLQNSEAWTEDNPPTLELVTEIAHKVGKLYRQVYIVIDALDEVKPAPQGIKEAITGLRGLQTSFGAKLLFTIRNLPDIMGQLPEGDHLDITANEEDVSAFVDHKLRNIVSSWEDEFFPPKLDELKKSIMLCSKET